MRKLKNGFAPAAVAGLVLTCLSLPAQAAGYGDNLVINGGAEASSGVASTSVTTMLPPAGWVTTGNITAAQYGGAGGFPLASSPGPLDRGANFFAGGRSSMGMGTAISSASQEISLNSYLGDIAGGQVGYSFSAYLGGYSTDNDNAGLTLTFLNASHAVISSVLLPSVLAAERSNITGLLLRETSGYVPVGTQSVALLLTMTKTKGMYNDSSADNIAFALAAPVPEPETYAMLLAGLGLMGGIARRRTAGKAA